MDEHLNQTTNEHLELSTLEISRIKEKVMMQRTLISSLIMVLKETLYYHTVPNNMSMVIVTYIRNKKVLLAKFGHHSFQSCMRGSIITQVHL